LAEADAYPACLCLSTLEFISGLSPRRPLPYANAAAGLLDLLALLAMAACPARSHLPALECRLLDAGPRALTCCSSEPVVTAQGSGVVAMRPLGR